MMAPSVRRWATILVVLLASSAAIAQRDTTRSGTSQISGVACLVDDLSQPVRRAIVSLYAAGEKLGRHMVTDDSGAFSFEALPEGRYSISASRPAFVTIPFGAKKPGRPGSPLFIGRGERLTGIRVLLARGAAITGVARDSVGEPIPGLDIRVERFGAGSTAPSVVSAKTDDQGQYRVFGLAAGTYLVSARPRPMGTADRIVPSDAEVDEALRQLRTPAAGRGFSSPPAPAQADVNAAARMSDFVPVYHPSAFLPEEASPVILQMAEERAGIDILVRLMSTALVSGRVVGLDGRNPVGFEMTMTKAGSTTAAGVSRTGVQPGGEFVFPSVIAGRYLLAVKTVRSSQSSPASGSCQFAAEEVLVTGADHTGLSLALKPCLRIAGLITFPEGAKVARPSDLSGVRVVLEPDVAARAASYLPFRAPAVVGADGRFTLGEAGDVMPGAYRVTVILPENLMTDGWRPDTIAVDGRDVTDVPLEITTAAAGVIPARVVLSAERASLSGNLDTSGPAASDFSVIAFTTNRSWWRAPFRRVQAARPSVTGQFTFHDLPPGEYYLVALTELAPDDWRDAEFLAEIAQIAIRFTLNAGEQKIQNLKIARAGGL